MDEAVLDAATSLLRAGGYVRLSMREVAETAGVSRQSVHLRWSTKLELVMEVLRRQAATVPIDPDGDLGAALDSLHGTANRGDLPLLAGIITEMQANPALADAYRREIDQPRRALFAQLLARARARGELAPDTDVDLLSEVVPALILRRVLISGEPVDDAYLDRVRDAFFLRTDDSRPRPTG